MPLDAGQEEKTAASPRVTLYLAAVAFLASQPRWLQLLVTPVLLCSFAKGGRNHQTLDNLHPQIVGVQERIQEQVW
jgi:hypothetical protein